MTLLFPYVQVCIRIRLPMSYHLLNSPRPNNDAGAWRIQDWSFPRICMETGLTSPMSPEHPRNDAFFGDVDTYWLCIAYSQPQPTYPACIDPDFVWANSRPSKEYRGTSGCSCSLDGKLRPWYLCGLLGEDWLVSHNASCSKPCLNTRWWHPILTSSHIHMLTSHP